MKKFVLLFVLSGLVSPVVSVIPNFSSAVFALNIPQTRSIESIAERKLGYQMLRAIWQSGWVLNDIEMQTYLKRLGADLVALSANSEKHFGFLMLNNTTLNAFAGYYGYINVYTGLLAASDTEAELAGVLAHEITHVTQNHLVRSEHKNKYNPYLMALGMLSSTLIKDSEIAQAVSLSTVASVAQKSIDFTREHEWEADRLGMKILARSGFDPKGMAHFFDRLKDDPNAKEFLRTHPLSINRVADSLQRTHRMSGDYLPNSFEYISAKIRIYAQHHDNIRLEKTPAAQLYARAYQAFEAQKYKSAQAFADKLLALNTDKPSYILAGRIASKLGNLKQAQDYFAQNSLLHEDEASVYYAAQTYFQHQKPKLGIALLKQFARGRTVSVALYQLLSQLYVQKKDFVRAQIENGNSMIAQGEFIKAIGHYEHAQSIAQNQDMRDVLHTRIKTIQKMVDLYQKEAGWGF